MFASPYPSTGEVLSTLCTSVLEWHGRLDELNGQIALRQIELARLEEDRLSTRSLRNKGSTESLRPNDGPKGTGEEKPLNGDAEHTQIDPSASPNSPKQYKTPGQRPSSATAPKATAQIGALFTPPPQHLNSMPKTPPAVFARPPSNPTSPVPARAAPSRLRKRKPESLTSGESAVPKYRTRSMIIVYYDSAVQQAFEELVKFVSGSRNAMRKGKMAARMAEMRRAAEQEVEADGESDGDDGFQKLSSFLSRDKVSSPLKGITSDELEGEIPLSESISGMPRVTSSRLLGLSNDLKPDTLRHVLNTNVLRRTTNEKPDIFEQIDKALEWCQSHCEHAAHKFLREGECSGEIDNIKNKLSQVRETAEKEVQRLKDEEVARPPTQRQVPEESKNRELKFQQMRKDRDRDWDRPKDLEVDTLELGNMEVDDEGFEELAPSALVFKRSRDVHRR